jgi:hypothetical protein
VSDDAALASVAWIAGRSVELDEDERRGAVRRALLLLAAGGDPSRDLTLDSRAVTALAADLDRAERRAELTAALESLRSGAEALLADPERAWLAFACSVLAEELADE